MKIINKLLTRNELESYLTHKKMTRRIDKIVLHHTHSTVAEWKSGDRSIKYYKSSYEEKGWDSAPHFFCSPGRHLAFYGHKQRRYSCQCGQ